MKKFLFLICFILFFSNQANAQCFNGCRVNSYYPHVVYFEPSLNYEIRNITETERFYVAIKAWDRNYTIPVINGYLPEITHNGNYNSLILDYSSRIEYTKEKFGRLQVINYSNSDVKNVKLNSKPSVPKGPDVPVIKNTTSGAKSNVPKRPDNSEIDSIFNNKAKKIERPKDDLNESIDNIFKK